MALLAGIAYVMLIRGPNVLGSRAPLAVVAWRAVEGKPSLPRPAPKCAGVNQTGRAAETRTQAQDGK
jgi:hypothetical protein